MIETILQYGAQLSNPAILAVVLVYLLNNRKNGNSAITKVDNISKTLEEIKDLHSQYIREIKNHECNQMIRHKETVVDLTLIRSNCPVLKGDKR
jgi:hypothetical protein